MNKFVVDVWVDYARSYEIEAATREEAEAKVEKMVLAQGFDPIENGFERTDDIEVRSSSHAH